MPHSVQLGRADAGRVGSSFFRCLLTSWVMTRALVRRELSVERLRRVEAALCSFDQGIGLPSQRVGKIEQCAQSRIHFSPFQLADIGKAIAQSLGERRLRHTIPDPEVRHYGSECLF